MLPECIEKYTRRMYMILFSYQRKRNVYAVDTELPGDKSIRQVRGLILLDWQASHEAIVFEE